MTSLSQSLRDRILWILANHGGIMERSRLRRRMGMRYADLRSYHIEQTAHQRQIEATDQQIDALVYRLYGLTEEEIAIVEGR